MEADVVVPCYNGERTLRAAIESALVQDCAASIVVVDDGSIDGSLALARSFEPRVRVLTGPNRGVASARNRGAAETSADWIIFVDADDLLIPGTIRARLAAAGAGRADLAICDWEDFSGDGPPPAQGGLHRGIDWKGVPEDPALAVAKGAWAPTAAILYHRSIFERAGGFRADVTPVEDARFLFDAVTGDVRIAHLKQIGARYRILAGSLSRADPARFWQSVLHNGRQIETLWRDQHVLDAEHAQALSDIYDTAARGLLAVADPAFFDAVTACRRLGLRRSRHNRLATPLARLFGVRTARDVLALARRS